MWMQLTSSFWNRPDREIGADGKESGARMRRSNYSTGSDAVGVVAQATAGSTGAATDAAAGGPDRRCRNRRDRETEPDGKESGARMRRGNYSAGSDAVGVVARATAGSTGAATDAAAGEPDRRCRNRRDREIGPDGKESGARMRRGTNSRGGGA